MPNYYEILGVAVEATEEELETAYLRAISTYKKDSIAAYGIVSEEDRGKILNDIEVAFNTLNNRETRINYDRDILKIDISTRSNEIAQILDNTPDETEEKKGRLVQLMLGFKGKNDSKNIEVIIDKDSLPPKQDSTNTIFVSELTHLKEVRELKGISLRDIANETRVSISYLRAIEEGDFSEMPEDIYARGFIKAFAEHLELNPEQFIESYRRYKDI